MGKWLKPEEIEDADYELLVNKIVIGKLREVIRDLQYRNTKLSNAIYYRKNAKDFQKNSYCYQKYGKSFRDLTKLERKEYLAFMKKKSRENTLQNKNDDV